MFSFIAGEGASQLARLSSPGHYSSFNRSVSDSQHKSLHSKICVCVCGVRADACASGSPVWCHQPANQHNPESRWTPGSCRGSLDWLAYSTNVRVHMRACTSLCVARQVGVNPIRLPGFKCWWPGTPKPVTSAHPATAPHSSIPSKHSHIGPASYYGTSVLRLLETRVWLGLRVVT